MSKTIIIIEDDSQIADLIEILLESQALQVRHYDDGREGLAAVRDFSPDLILLDINVPGMNGWDIYDAVRGGNATQHIPIIILSVSQQTFDRRVSFVHSRIDFFMNKPFDIIELREKIDSILAIKDWKLPAEQPHQENHTAEAPLQNIKQRLTETGSLIQRPEPSNIARQMREAQERKPKTDKLNPDTYG